MFNFWLWAMDWILKNREVKTDNSDMSVMYKLNFLIITTAIVATVVFSLGLLTTKSTLAQGQVPTVTLEQSTDLGITYSPNDAAINAGDTVYLKWTSTNANKCTGSGPGFRVTGANAGTDTCLLYTSPSPRDRTRSRMPSSA